MSSIIENLGDPTQFLDETFKELHNDGFDVSGYELDHICYRVETMERYEEIKSLLDILNHESLYHL